MSFSGWKSAKIKSILNGELPTNRLGGGQFTPDIFVDDFAPTDPMKITRVGSPTYDSWDEPPSILLIALFLIKRDWQLPITTMILNTVIEQHYNR